jgi:hypothetical protein
MIQQMAESSPESTRAVLKSLDRMAHKVLESPKSDREAVYELMRARLGHAGRAFNLSDKEVAGLRGQLHDLATCAGGYD